MKFTIALSQLWIPDSQYDRYIHLLVDDYLLIYRRTF